MKRILLSFCTLLIAITAFAQNYLCVDPAVKRYFINDNYYLRGIRIDSVKTIGSDTVLYPFKSPRGNYYTEKLKPKGSWLGEQITIKPDGTTLFDNYWGDTVVIKTQAQLSDSWIFYNDTSSIYYTATVTAIDTMTVLGSLDSVKTITLNAYNSLGIITTNLFNNTKIKLGKNNGLVDILNIYIFPRDVKNGSPADYDYLSKKGAFDKSPVLHLVQFENSNASKIYDFQPYDQFEILTYAGTDDFIKLYIISSRQNINTSNIKYTRYVLQEHRYNPTQVKTTTAKNDSISYYMTLLIDTIKMPEETGQQYFYHFYHNDTSFCHTSNKYIIADNYIAGDGTVNTFEPCGASYTFKNGLGRIGYSQCYDPSGSHNVFEYLSYAYKNGIRCGQYVFLNTEEIERKQFNIYPNPANEAVIIETTENNTISLINTLGQIVMQAISVKEKTTLSLSDIQPGIYYIRITDRNGVVKMQKLSVQK